MAVLFYSGVMDPSEWRDALRVHDPAIDLRAFPDIGPVEDIDTILAWRPPAGTYARLPNLKLIYCSGAGVDQLMADPELPRHLPVVRIVDTAQAADMATYVLHYVLRRHRGFDAYDRFQREGKWDRMPHRTTAATRVGIMGMGALGTTVSRHLTALGFPVAGWARSPKAVPNVECFAGEAGLDAFLARTDILVCLLPLTPDTTDILNARLFARLPKGAFVINVGRGKHLVEEDLIPAIESGQLSGAALDVYRQEPIPADHPFWAHPAIQMTPHIAGLAAPENVAQQIVENLRRLKSGEPLLNRVDLTVGY